MRIQPIRDETSYQKTLARIEALMDAKPTNANTDEMEVLAVLVENYEDRHFVLPKASPREAIRFALERRGMSPKDLVGVIGQRNRVHEILSGKRELTIAMIRRLVDSLDMSADDLIGAPVAVQRARQTAQSGPQRSRREPARQSAVR